MERKGKASPNGRGEAYTTEERDGVKLELSTRSVKQSVPEVKQDTPVMARFLSDEFTDRDWKKMENSVPKKKKPLPGVLKGVLLLSLLTAAGILGYLYFSGREKTEAPSEEPKAIEETETGAAKDEDLKARGTVIITEIDTEQKKIRFRNPESGEEYLLNTTDSTVYESDTGQPMVLAQLKIGDIVDILVSVHSSELSSVKQNTDENAFEYRDITDYDIQKNKGIFSYDGNNYRLLPGIFVMAGDDPSSLKEIKDGDVLTVCGRGRDVFVIKETGGNGYVRVTGAESFKGGWIELGNTIRPIEDEMIFTVPEGDYVMKVTYMHYGGSKNVSVKRGKESRIDVSDLKGDLLKTGMITFAFEPVEANPEVYIDGKMIVKEKPLELDYGVHTLEVKADGYVNIRKYLKVGEPMANLTIVLEEEEEEVKNTASGNRSEKEKEDKGEKEEKSKPIPRETLPETFKTGNSAGAENTGEKEENVDREETGEETETVTTDIGQLYIDGPPDTEVYFDGAYKGIAPCHFRKDGGTHVITLMKDGCETKSYTLNLSTGTDNESYTFNELVEENDA